MAKFKVGTEAHEGSELRFHVRVQKFRDAGIRFPTVVHYFWWIMHNFVAHSMLAFIPFSFSFKFHD